MGRTIEAQNLEDDFLFAKVMSDIRFRTPAKRIQIYY